MTIKTFKEAKREQKKLFNKDEKRLYKLISQFFQGNDNKTNLWFNTPNPNLGGIRPIEMLRLNRIKKLSKYISSTLAENTRE